MKDTITINNKKLKLNFEPQTSPNGRLLRLSGITLVTTKPAQWINKVLTHGTIYSFRYIGTDEFIAFEFTPDGKFIGKV